MDTSVFDTVRRYMKAGMTLGQAIQKWEGMMHVPLPQFMQDKIREEILNERDSL